MEIGGDSSNPRPTEALGFGAGLPSWGPPVKPVTQRLEIPPHKGMRPERPYLKWLLELQFRTIWYLDPGGDTRSVRTPHANGDFCDGAWPSRAAVIKAWQS